MYKMVACPECNGHGIITGCDEHSIWGKTCDNCHGEGFISANMTNGDVIRQCNNEELLKVFYNLKHWAIYSGGNNKRLLYQDDPEDFLLWLNKEADRTDMKTIFDFIDEEEHDRDYHPYAKAKVSEV